MADDTGEAYQSLYRRYRPQLFADVRGQEHVTTALRNAVRTGRVAHAYLFSGPRGTGKTSTARILAMALDCENPVDGEPDGTCPSCVDIRRGASMDVQELDAASNRKLDEMRDLLSRVSLGTRGRWKVYIVDEVHQLTADAASALLKTLEEPPAHVIFVLATTDPQKVLPTIRSRTQHFEFRLLSADTLGGLLADINREAALGVAPEAIDLVVRRGHGSARDALSVLDQVAAAGDVDDEVTVVSDIVDALADHDAGRVLVATAEGMAAGREPRRLATDLLDHLRNAFLALTARGLVHLPDDAAAVAEGQGHRLGLAGVVRAMEVIGQAAADMRDSVDARVTLEVALVRVASPAVSTDMAALVARVERLEQQVAGGGAAGQGTEASSAAPTRPESDAGAPPTSAVDEGDAPGGAVPAAGARPAERIRPSGRPTRTDRPGGRAEDGRPFLGAPPPTPRPGGLPAPTAGSGPAPTGPPASPARPTIGAHRRSADPSRGAAPPPDGPAATGPPPGPPGRQPGDDGPVLRYGGDRSDARRPPAQGEAAADHRPSSARSTAEVGARTEEAPRTDAGPGLPSRDELTKVWGDSVLSSLPARVKAYLAQGRFTAVDDAAVFALPDRGLLSRAEGVRADAEGALAAHFGRKVPLRLILDATGAPAGTDAPPPTDEDPSAYDLDDLSDAGPAVRSHQQRLLEAFPGAEEVTP